MTDDMLNLGEDRHLTVDEFFASMRGDRNGWFLVPKGWIGEGELAVDETVLFCQKGQVKYVAQTASAREDNDGRDADKFPYRFRMEPSSIREVRVAVSDLQRRFDALGLKVNLKGRGWTKIPETAEARAIVEEVLRKGSAV